MRRLALSGGAAAVICLSGCASYTAPGTNQFYLSLEYAPILTGMGSDTTIATVIQNDGRRSDKPADGRLPLRNDSLDATDGCAASGVLPAGPPQDGDGGKLFEPALRSAGLLMRPGMKLRATQIAARGRAAADVPDLSDWAWTLPRPRSSPCGGTALARPDILAERALVYGAHKFNASPPVAPVPTPRALPWNALVEAAANGGEPTESRLRDGLFDAMPRHLYVGYRFGEYPGAPDLPKEPVGKAQTETGLALAFAELCGLHFATQLAPLKRSEAADCADADKWDPGASASPPHAACGRTRKALKLDVANFTSPNAALSLSRGTYVLLSEGDDFFLEGSMQAADMVEGAFDGRGSVGGRKNSPPWGEAWQGFTDFEVLIPIEVAGEAAPRWVSACSTAGTFQSETGLQVKALRRAAYWVDNRVMVQRDRQPSAVETDQKTFRDSQGRIRFEFGTGKAVGSSIQISDANDFLLAPGDQLILEPRARRP